MSGLTTDYCVKNSAIDALFFGKFLGFKKVESFIIDDLTESLFGKEDAYKDPNIDNKGSELIGNKVKIIHSEQFEFS